MSYSEDTLQMRKSEYLRVLSLYNVSVVSSLYSAKTNVQKSACSWPLSWETLLEELASSSNIY